MRPYKQYIAIAAAVTAMLFAPEISLAKPNLVCKRKVCKLESHKAHHKKVKKYAFKKSKKPVRKYVASKAMSERQRKALARRQVAKARLIANSRKANEAKKSNVLTFVPAPEIKEKTQTVAAVAKPEKIVFTENALPDPNMFIEPGENNLAPISTQPLAESPEVETANVETEVSRTTSSYDSTANLEQPESTSAGPENFEEDSVNIDDYDNYDE
jgi:hypothetical protein